MIKKNPSSMGVSGEPVRVDIDPNTGEEIVKKKRKPFVRIARGKKKDPSIEPTSEFQKEMLAVEGRLKWANDAEFGRFKALERKCTNDPEGQCFKEWIRCAIAWAINGRKPIVAAMSLAENKERWAGFWHLHKKQYLKPKAGGDLDEAYRNKERKW